MADGWLNEGPSWGGITAPSRPPPQERGLDWLRRGPAWDIASDFALPEMGFLDAWSQILDRGIKGQLPFISTASEVADAMHLNAAVGRMERGEATAEDEQYVSDYLRILQSPKSAGYKFLNIVGQLLPFFGEFAATGGLMKGIGQFGSLAAKDAAEKALLGKGIRAALAKRAKDLAETAAYKKFAGTMAGRIAAKAPQAAGQLGLMELGGQIAGAGGIISRETWQRSIDWGNSGVIPDGAGGVSLFLDAHADTFLEALPKGLVSAFIEVWSEKMGEELVKLPIVNQVKDVQSQFLAWYSKKHAGGQLTKGMRQLAHLANWDGMIGEYLEEVAGTALRAATPGLEERWGDVAEMLLPSEAVPMLAAFAVPGAVGAGVIAATPKSKIEALEKERGEKIKSALVGKAAERITLKGAKEGTSVPATPEQAQVATQRFLEANPGEALPDAPAGYEAVRDFFKDSGVLPSFVRTEGKTASEAQISDNGRVVVIDTAEAPGEAVEGAMWRVTYHELFHSLVQRDPKLATKLARRLIQAKPLEFDKHLERYFGAEIQRLVEEEGLSEEEARARAAQLDLAEEGVADVVANMWPLLRHADATFWRELLDEPSLVKRLLERLKELLNKLPLVNIKTESQARLDKVAKLLGVDEIDEASTELAALFQEGFAKLKEEDVQPVAAEPSAEAAQTKPAPEPAVAEEGQAAGPVQKGARPAPGTKTPRGGAKAQAAPQPDRVLERPAPVAQPEPTRKPRPESVVKLREALERHRASKEKPSAAPTSQKATTARGKGKGEKLQRAEGPSFKPGETVQTPHGPGRFLRQENGNVIVNFGPKARPQFRRFPVEEVGTEGKRSLRIIPEEPLKYPEAGHFSRELFEKFDTSFMSSGVGDQWYGWGIYLWSHPQVAEYYRRLLQDVEIALPEGYEVPDALLALADPRDAETDAMSEVNYWLDTLVDVYRKYGWDVAVGWLENIFIQEKYEEGSLRVTALDHVLEMAELGMLGISEKRAAGYRVRLQPKEEELLDWDRPWHEQSEHVRKAVRRIKGVAPRRVWGVFEPGQSEPAFSADSKAEANTWLQAFQESNPDAGYTIAEVTGDKTTGQELYRRLQKRLGSEKDASLRLHELGVRGIKFLDYGSRPKGSKQQTHNYVIFHGDDIAIVDVKRSLRQISELAQRVVDGAKGGRRMQELNAVILLADAMRDSGNGDFAAALEEIARRDEATGEDRAREYIALFTPPDDRPRDLPLPDKVRIQITSAAIARARRNYTRKEREENKKEYQKIYREVRNQYGAALLAGDWDTARALKSGVAAAGREALIWQKSLAAKVRTKEPRPAKDVKAPGVSEEHRSIATRPFESIPLDEGVAETAERHGIRLSKKELRRLKREQTPKEEPEVDVDEEISQLDEQLRRYLGKDRRSLRRPAGKRTFYTSFDDMTPDGWRGIVESTLIKVGDMHLPVKRWEEWALKEGADIPISIYAWLTRLPSQIQEHYQQFHNAHVDVINQILAKFGISAEDFGEYTYMLHVPERNEWFEELAAEADELMRQHKELTKLLPMAKSWIELQGQYYPVKSVRVKVMTGDIRKDLESLRKRAQKLRDASTDGRGKAWHREDNPGSGVKNSEAAAAVADFESRPNAAGFKEAAKRLHKMNRRALRIMERGGLISEEDFRFYLRRWKNYVPLMGWEIAADEDNVHSAPLARAAGINIPVHVLKRARGRHTKAENPWIHSQLQAKKAIAMAHTNQVGQELLKILKEHPDLMLEDIQHMDEDEWREFRVPEESIGVKVGGERYVIRLKSKRFAAAIKQSNLAHWPRTLEFIAKAIRNLAALSTSWNPEFMLSNFFRDLFQASVNLTEQEKEGLVMKVGADTLGGKPIRALHTLSAEASKGRTIKVDEIDASVEVGRRFDVLDDDWLKYARMYLSLGTATGWYWHDSFEDTLTKMHKELMDVNGSGGPFRTMQRAGRKALDFLEDWNFAIENGVRLATFRRLIEDHGFTPEEASNVAKNLTINFNRRGEWGPVLNVLWMFYNASMQGTLRIFSALRHPSGGPAKITAGLVLAGIISDMGNAAMGGDDDEGEVNYDKIPQWVKERNAIWMVPGSSWHLMLPLPYGFNVFFGLGQAIGAAARGAIGPSEAVGNVLGSVVEAFSPIGQERSVAQFLSPTVLDLPIQLWENRSFYGGPIRPEQPQFGAERPRSQLYFNSVSPAAKWVTDALAELTGGDPLKPGLVDVSPEDVEHVVEFIFGGVGKFGTRTLTTLLQRTDTPIRQVPMVRRFVGAESDFHQQMVFFENAKEISDLNDRYRSYLRLGYRENASELRRRAGGIMRLQKQAQAVSALRKRVMDALPDLDEPERQQRLKLLDSRYRAFNATVRKAR